MHRSASAASVRKVALVAAFVAAVLAFPAQSSAAQMTIAPRDELESAVATRINAIRASRGLAKLRFRRGVNAAATKHATNMALNGYFTHSWSSGAPFGTWIQWWWPGPGYSSWSAGENLYWHSGETTAREVVNAWMNSSGHRANILKSSWRAIGVGAIKVSNPVGVYRSYSSVTIVATEFGRRS